MWITISIILSAGCPPENQQLAALADARGSACQDRRQYVHKFAETPDPHRISHTDAGWSGQELWFFLPPGMELGKENGHTRPPEAGVPRIRRQAGR